ncbi:MAG: hypothetical protein Kow0092_36950 [Deferrisomatales bacterium]
MSKPVKVLGWLVGIVVVLLVGATVALKVYLTKDRILAWVVPPLEARLHRKVQVADAGAGVTGLHLDGLDVRAEGAPEPLVAAEALRIRWNLWALVTGKVEVDEVRLVEPRIHLVRLPDGSLDIDDLLGGGPAEGEAPPAAAPGEGPGVEVAVALISMERGRISFEDRTRTPARTYVLDEIASRVTELSLDRPFRYELTATLPLAEAGRFSAEGTVDPATRDVAARLRVEGFDLPALNREIEGATRFSGGTLGADFQVELGGGRRAAVEGEVRIDGLALAAGSATGQPADLSVELAAAADLPAGTAELTRLDLQVAGQRAHAEGRASGLGARPRLDVKITSEELRVDPLTALLPPAPEGTAVPAEPTAAAGPAAVPLDLFGDLAVGRLLAGGVEVEDFAAKVALEDGVLRVEPAGAKVYGGALDLKLRAELERPGPPFETRVGLDGTQVGALLAGVSPALENTMTGTLEMQLEAQGRGGDLEALRSQAKAEAKDGKLLNHPLVQGFARLFQVKELETINFYSLKADVETAEGNGRLHSLILNGPNVQATGKGTFGLVDRQLDLQLAVALPRRIAAKVVPDARTLDAVTDAEGWTRLPLRLRGTFDRPAYGLDAEALARAAAKAYGGKAREKIEEKVLEKIPLGEEQKGTLQKKLKKFFGQ